ncbi:hypothetical protein L5515_012845 [Caenorhabditis briggsae]|uniref:Uncharacterized protein n=1 Tax=Caenorhabditis briggsae TaxID=6238 RepID=A0AAE9JIE0_CAEBR|nr:hypothetical protein L5515_012845 [Caenorhabditis briggsae]
MERRLIELLTPVWYWFKRAFKFYTNLRPFEYTHFSFCHSFLFTACLFEPLFRKTKHAEFLPFNRIFLIIFAQCLNHVIFGLFGMIISVWTLVGCIIARQFSLIVGLLYILALCFFLASYSMFSNVSTDLYLVLPLENHPFFGIKTNVVLLGLFYLAVSIVTFLLTEKWPLCCLLLFSSFFFSIDAWSCFFTKSYFLCEHQRHESDLLRTNRTPNGPIGRIICHVIVRRNSRKMKNSMKLPSPLNRVSRTTVDQIGFQFDDMLDIRKLQYREPEYL